MPAPMNPLLRAARAGRRPALFLDYDGTLVPLGPDPRRARLTAARRETLRRLAARFPVAVISGRSLNDLKGMIGLPGLVLAGNHGLEIGVGEARWVHPQAARARFALEALLGEIRPALAAVPRVLIEDKGLTLSVHYRLSPRGSEAKIGRLLRRLLAGRKKELVLNTGKDVYEIGPRAAWNKGKAAIRILQTAFPPGSLPVYIGDDTTDEDAFRILAPIGLTARVGGERRTAAQYRLEGIDAVWSFLRGLGQKAVTRGDRGGRNKTTRSKGRESGGFDIIETMDIFLSAGAQKVLESLAVLSKTARPAGFLIGHVRGGRFFIESAFGGGDADWAAPETYESLDRIHPGRIVGFFVFSQAAAARRPAARPHACGKAVLAIKKSGGGLDMRGFLVDFDRRFEFVPIEVRREKEARP